MRVYPRLISPWLWASVSLCRSLSPLHLIAKNAFDNLRISARPASKIIDGKRILDGCEFLVFLGQSVIRTGPKMIFDEGPLRVIRPQVLHERGDNRPIGC